MIEIVPYRDSWPREFLDIAQHLRAAVSAGIVAIHHIGSTSVPGLAAKNIIDIQITVADLAAKAESPIQTAGFKLGPHVTDHCPPGLSLPAPELAKRLYNFTARPANVHVREAGRFNQRYPLLCRDYLRTHKLAADAYGAIKRQLARHFPDNTDAYYDIKDPVFDLFMAGAEDWAAATGWTQPPGD